MTQNQTIAAILVAAFVAYRLGIAKAAKTAAPADQTASMGGIDWLTGGAWANV